MVPSKIEQTNCICAEQVRLADGRVALCMQLRVPSSAWCRQEGLEAQLLTERARAEALVGESAETSAKLQRVEGALAEAQQGLQAAQAEAAHAEAQLGARLRAAQTALEQAEGEEHQQVAGRMHGVSQAEALEAAAARVSTLEVRGTGCYLMLVCADWPAGAQGMAAGKARA